MEFKERLTKLRRMKGMSQSDLARATDLTVRSIKNYEAGDRMPKADTIYKLAVALDVDEKALITDEEFFIIEANDKYGARGKASAQKLVANAQALFAGGDLTDEDKSAVLEAIQEAYWKSKLTNKKYTPKKYRKEN